MWGWPTEQETLVLPIPARVVARRLREVTRLREDQEDPSSTRLLFNGAVDQHSFRLSQKITRPNNFLPFITGTIEPTSQGCLLLVRYRLFTMTIIFLLFWLMVTLAFGIYLIRYEQLYHYAALSIGVGVANYVVALLNFRKQVKISRRLLQEAIT